VFDMAHIVEALNKVCGHIFHGSCWVSICWGFTAHVDCCVMSGTWQLDVGDSEEVLLSSPDEQTLLVASYVPNSL